MFDDLRYAVRAWRQTWISSIAIVLMIALGAGASGGIVALAAGVMANPLGLDEPERLVVLDGALPSLAGDLASATSFLDYRDALSGFDGLAAHSEHDGSVTLNYGSLATRARGAEVTPGFFALLGVPLKAGREFTDDEATPGRNRVVVISDGLRRQVFSQTEEPIGQLLRLNDVVFSVVGIVDGDFRFPGAAEFWVPISLGRDRFFTGQAISYQVLGRLSQEVSLRAAQRSLAEFPKRAAALRPGSWPTHREVKVVALTETLIANVHRSFQLLLLALGLVWLAAIANIGVMLFARSASQSREFAVRWALGASRGTFIRLFLWDAVLLTAASFVAGVLAVFLGLRAVVLMLPASANAIAPGIDGFSVLLVLGFAGLTGILVMLPVVRLSAKVDWFSRLRSTPGTRTETSSTRRQLLVLTQVCFATILIGGTIATTRTLRELQKTELGFSADHVYLLSVGPILKGGMAKQLEVIDAAVSSVQRFPGVTTVAASTSVPLDGSDVIGLLYSIQGLSNPRAFNERFALLIAVTSEYFSTLEIPLVAGRPFSTTDSATSGRVVIVNESLATKYGDPRSLLGKRLVLPGGQAPAEIVGVVGDVRHLGSLRPAGPQVYVPHTQLPARITSIVVRGEDLRPEHMDDLRALVSNVDSSVALYETRPLSSLVDASAVDHRRLAWLFGVFAFIGIALAGIAAYAVVMHYVTEARREVGVRRALGAKGRHIAGLVVRQSVGPTVAGSSVGVVAIIWLSKAGAKMGLALSPLGVFDYSLTVVGLLVLALIACAAPTVAALRITPSRILREG